MTLEYKLKRYAAYYRGWCQAFGEHESIPGDDGGISWLFAEKQIGFISPRKQNRSLLREILRKSETPTLMISQNGIRVGSFSYRPDKASDESALTAISNFLESGNGTHIFLTSHFMYGTGVRILTLSSIKPLSIIYKEIGSMLISLK